MSSRVDDARCLASYFATYSARETGAEALVLSLRSRVGGRLNGSVLAALRAGEARARVSYSEKDRSATDSFWREIVDDLETFLGGLPKVISRKSFFFSDDRTTT